MGHLQSGHFFGPEEVNNYYEGETFKNYFLIVLVLLCTSEKLKRLFAFELAGF